VAIAVALADKLDTLVGFWAIDEKPTGSGDPYQLRRAALGVIRIVIENDLRVPLMSVFEAAAVPVEKSMADASKARDDKTLKASAATVQWSGRAARASSVDLLSFFAERLKIYLRDK